MGIPHARVNGIYQIKCVTNNMVYIGKSEWIGSRWGYHLFTLLSGTHRNKELQDDFDKYGVESFVFSILEIVSDTKTLDCAELSWVKKFDESQIYNIRLIKSISPSQQRVDAFTKYVRDKWLLPIGSNVKVSNKYKIRKQEDKEEIVDKFVECGLSDKPRSLVTYQYVIKTLAKKFGYKILGGRERFKDEGFLHYRMIISCGGNCTDMED